LSIDPRLTLASFLIQSSWDSQAWADGVLIARVMGHGEEVQQIVRLAFGVALLLVANGSIVRAYRRLLTLRVWPTIAVGILGAAVLGLTSVGSGSLVIIARMSLYPTLRASALVGTDLEQAVSLVAAAALGHLLFGDFKLDLTTSLLLGCVPGVYIGAHLSAVAPREAGLTRDSGADRA
jgi:uncharacterized protein